MKSTGPLSVGTIYALAFAIVIAGGFFYNQDRKEILSGISDIKTELDSIRSTSDALRLRNVG